MHDKIAQACEDLESKRELRMRGEESSQASDSKSQDASQHLEPVAGPHVQMTSTSEEVATFACLRCTSGRKYKGSGGLANHYHRTHGALKVKLWDEFPSLFVQCGCADDNCMAAHGNILRPDLTAPHCTLKQVSRCLHII